MVMVLNIVGAVVLVFTLSLGVLPIVSVLFLFDILCILHFLHILRTLDGLRVIDLHVDAQIVH